MSLQNSIEAEDFETADTFLCSQHYLTKIKNKNKMEIFLKEIYISG
jgi:hypothetical protein